MIKEKDLKFRLTPFEHLRKENRDNYQRMTWVGSVENHFVTVHTIFKDNNWKLELLEVENDSDSYVRKKYLPDNYSLSDVLVMIKLVQM